MVGVMFHDDYTVLQKFHCSKLILTHAVFNINILKLNVGLRQWIILQIIADRNGIYYQLKTLFTLKLRFTFIDAFWPVL